MSNDQIFHKIIELIHETFENDSISISRDTTADDVDEWDSMSHLQLIDAVEKFFKVRFALGELQALKDVGNLVDLIEKKATK